MFPFKCKHKLTNTLTVSGYGYTEYEIRFCKKCGKIVWKLTKDFDRLYPKIINKIHE